MKVTLLEQLVTSQWCTTTCIILNGNINLGQYSYYQLQWYVFITTAHFSK